MLNGFLNGIASIVTGGGMPLVLVCGAAVAASVAIAVRVAGK